MPMTIHIDDKHEALSHTCETTLVHPYPEMGTLPSFNTDAHCFMKVGWDFIPDISLSRT